MDEYTIMYLSISGILIFIVIAGYGAYGAFAPLIIVLAILAMLVILLLNYADFVIFPVITQVLGIKVLLWKDYMVPKTENCVIKYTKGLYYAQGYLSANIYNYIFAAENINQEEDAGIISGADKWERIVMSIDFPFKFNVVSLAEELQKHREELEGRRGFLQFQMSREMSSGNPNTLTIQELQKKINIIQARIDRISAGERPVKTIMYIETVAVGVSEKEATDNLTNQLNKLITVFNSFDLSIMRVTGREMHILNKLNYRIMDFDLLNRQFQLQK